MFEFPRGIYVALCVAAAFIVAAQFTLVGKVTWLPERGNGHAYLSFCEHVLLLLGVSVKAAPKVDPAVIK